MTIKNVIKLKEQLETFSCKGVHMLNLPTSISSKEENAGELPRSVAGERACSELEHNFRISITAVISTLKHNMSPNEQQNGQGRQFCPLLASPVFVGLRYVRTFTFVPSVTSLYSILYY